MTTKQIELPKNTYVLTECDDLFKLEKGNIIELDKENELKELFKYSFQHLDLIERIESSDKFIFVKSKMINNNDKYMLIIFGKNEEKIHNISFNFKKIEFKEDIILLYGENTIDDKTIIKSTAIYDYNLYNENTYQQLLESKKYIDDMMKKEGIITACSYDKNIFIIRTDLYDDWSNIYMNDERIYSFDLIHCIERDEGIFYQNSDHEWYYNDVFLEDIKSYRPQFGTKYILDTVEDQPILLKLNDWFKCLRCNIKISKMNTCDFCIIKYCDDCNTGFVNFYHCKTCNRNYCILDARDTFSEKIENILYNNSCCKDCRK